MLLKEGLEFEIVALLKKEDASDLATHYWAQNSPTAMYTTHSSYVCVPPAAIKFREQRVLGESRIVADVVQTYSNLGLFLATMLSRQFNHLKLQVYNVSELVHSLLVKLVKKRTVV